MSIELVMLSSHLILCCPLLLLPPIPPSISVFSNESALQEQCKMTIPFVCQGFPCGSAGEESTAMRETWVRSLGWEYPWRRKRLPTPVFWPGEFHGQRSLTGYMELPVRTWWLTCKYKDLSNQGRSPGEGNDNPLQYSGLENSMERGA